MSIKQRSLRREFHFIFDITDAYPRQQRHGNVTFIPDVARILVVDGTFSRAELIGYRLLKTRVAGSTRHEDIFHSRSAADQIPYLADAIKRAENASRNKKEN